MILWLDRYREDGDWNNAIMFDMNGHISLRLQGEDRERLATELQATLRRAVEQAQYDEERNRANRNQKPQPKRQNL